MLVTANAAVPLLLNDAVRLALVAPTGTEPNFKFVGLTDAAGVTVSVLDLLMSAAVPMSATDVLTRTALVAMPNAADCWP